MSLSRLEEMTLRIMYSILNTLYSQHSHAKKFRKLWMLKGKSGTKGRFIIV